MFHKGAPETTSSSILLVKMLFVEYLLYVFGYPQKKQN